MGVGMKLGGEHFPGRLIAGSIISFCLCRVGQWSLFHG